jgi:hypothetical protein
MIHGPSQDYSSVVDDVNKEQLIMNLNYLLLRTIFYGIIISTSK